MYCFHASLPLSLPPPRLLLPPKRAPNFRPTRSNIDIYNTTVRPKWPNPPHGTGNGGGHEGRGEALGDGVVLRDGVLEGGEGRHVEDGDKVFNGEDCGVLGGRASDCGLFGVFVLFLFLNFLKMKYCFLGYILSFNNTW